MTVMKSEDWGAIAVSLEPFGNGETSAIPDVNPRHHLRGTSWQ
jgi:hypothetical protein